MSYRKSTIICVTGLSKQKTLHNTIYKTYMYTYIAFWCNRVLGNLSIHLLKCGCDYDWP